MGWLFQQGLSRKDLVEQRTRDWERTRDDGMKITTTCIAHCYRGGAFSGVLWAVWERRFTRDGSEVEPSQRWISCDLLRYERDAGWGHKDMDESMGPFHYSCPLKYLDLVPIDQHGGNADWREQVRSYHARQRQKIKQRRLARTGG